MTYVIAYDIGTTGVKTCLFGIEKGIELLASKSMGYDLYIMDDGGAEQDQEQWWDSMCVTTKQIMEETKINPAEISGISFCSQMQGMVLVDKEGVPVHRPMSYMDQRSRKELAQGLGGGIQFAGGNLFKLLKNLKVNKVAPLSVKDPLWKYKWVENNEPENFKRAYKWFDVKEYLICRCTGEFTMTVDSAAATYLYDCHPGKEGWHKGLCKQYKVNMDHLPKVVKSTDKVGGLVEKAAKELGLKAGIPVFGGGGDVACISIGSGCVRVGDTHIYSGTSGWVATLMDQQQVDVGAMIGASVGAEPGTFNYFAEMETAGKCLEWVKDHLALDEIGIYLEKKHVAEGYESTYSSLYVYLTDVVGTVPAGAGGVIFTPWLHGNRCPFEDPNSAGIFFNVKLETGKTEMIRAVLEGVCYHLRWLLESEEKKVKTSSTIRFVGGGALNDVTCQMLADITGRTVETVDSPQNVGSVGAAAIMGVGLGVIESFEKVRDYIPVAKSFTPNAANKPIYDKNYNVFVQLYKTNKENFEKLNG